MTTKIDLMETGVSIGRLFRLALKNYFIIAISILLGLGMGFAYTISPFMDPGTYIAGGFVAFRISTNATVLNTVVEVIRSRAVAEEAAAFLALGDDETAPITMANGDPITPDIIRRNLSATTITNSLRIPILFSHPDRSIVVPVINAVIDASINIGNSDAYPIIAKNIVLGEYAISTVYDGPSRRLYLAIGALIGLMVGGVFGVLIDTFKGTVYSARDIKDLGLSSLEVPMNVSLPISLFTVLRAIGLSPKNLYEKKQLKNIDEGLLNIPAFTTIQNNLESLRANVDEPLTTLLVSPLDRGERLATVAFAYAKHSAKQGRKTLLIDFDLHNIPFTKLLQKYRLFTNPRSEASQDDSFLTLGDQLDLYLPHQQSIPAPFIRDHKTQQLMRDVKKTYDHIIILAPSALLDASLFSMVGYANSVIVVGVANHVTTTQVIKTVNSLVDAKFDTIETMVVSMKVKTRLTNLFTKKFDH
jgi:Mrp family chromosome partitioning ATPase